MLGLRFGVWGLGFGGRGSGSEVQIVVRMLHAVWCMVYGGVGCEDGVQGSGSGSAVERLYGMLMV